MTDVVVKKTQPLTQCYGPGLGQHDQGQTSANCWPTADLPPCFDERAQSALTLQPMCYRAVVKQLGLNFTD